MNAKPTQTTSDVFVTHGGTWPITRSCTAQDLIAVSGGLQCTNCGAYTLDCGAHWIPYKWR